MATTSKGFYYPVSSDVPDIPLHMQTLATDVDEYFDGVSTASKTETFTNKTISGASNTLSNIPNSALTNSSITINGSSVSLGGTTTIAGDLPSQTSQSGKYLTTNGTAASWASLGTWTAYTPTITGITANAWDARYMQVGKVVFLFADIYTNSAPTGLIYISTPSGLTGARLTYGISNFYSGASGYYNGTCYVTTGDRCYLVGLGTNGTNINQSNTSTIPFTWTTTGRFTMFVNYETY